MKRKLLLNLCLFLAFGLSFNLHAQQVFKTTKKSVIGYLQYLPKDYNSNSNRYPVVIFLHGIGERGPASNDPRRLESESGELSKIGPPYHVKKGTDFPFILITPQLKSNYRNWPTWYVKEVLDHIKSTLRIDDKRVYLTGLSLGGGGVWNTAQDLPEMFAAIAPVCGGYNSTSKAKGIAANNVAVWAFHGDKDNVVPLSRSANMVNAINSFDPNPKAKLSVYKGIRHDAWVKAYKPDHSEHSPNVYEWMMSQKRGAAPSEQRPVVNQPPVVSAGKDITITTIQSKAEIRATASDPDGKVKKYEWKQVSGKGLKMEGASSAKLVLSRYSEGNYAFRVTVTDDKGASKYDEVKFIVNKANTNKAPEVYAGKDQTITMKQSKVQFVASASDSDGKIKKYSWQQIAGKGLKMEGASSNKLRLSQFSEGKYEFRVTVTDDDGATKADQVVLTVKKDETVANKAPIVDLGSDRTLKANVTSLELSGSVSDPDGSIAKYQWTQTYGASARMNGDKNRVKITRLSAGYYTFRLTVWDNKNAYSFDEVRVVVEKDQSDANVKVIAYAGPDRLVRLPVNEIRLSGGADSPDKILSYQWAQTGGSGVSLSNQNSRTVKVRGITSAGVRTFQLTITDSKGRTAVDHIQVDFLPAVARASANPQETMEMVDLAEGLKDEEVEENVAFENWRGYYVTLYNDRGERIFSDKWTKDSAEEVYRTSGLYIYQLHSPSTGRRLKTGKIFIR